MMVFFLLDQRLQLIQLLTLKRRVSHSSFKDKTIRLFLSELANLFLFRKIEESAFGYQRILVNRHRLIVGESVSKTIIVKDQL